MSASHIPEAGPQAGPPSGRSAGMDRGLVAVSAVVVLGAIMSILDVTVVNVAIKQLGESFQAPLSTIQWVVTGYTLALATAIPITGWASHRFGTKRLYMLSIGLFVLGSALAGAAWSAESLIIFRVLQGLGGGMILPAGMTILTQAAGPERVGRVMSVVGVPMLLGPIFGPILGGWLVDDVSWRWIFYINVPLGALGLLLAWRILPKDEGQPTHRLDLIGLLLLSPGLAALIYGLAEGAGRGAFDSAEVLVTAIGGAVLIIAFVLRALRVSEPLIDLRLFTKRAFTTASISMSLFGVAFFGAMLLLPLYYQAVRFEGALDTGLLLAPQGIGAMLTMPLAGWLTDKIGPGKVVLAGMAVIVGTMSVFTQLQADTSYLMLGTVLFVMGMGMGLAMMPIMSAAFQTLSKDDVPKASTTMNIIQQVAGSIGTATMSVVLSNNLADRLPGAGGGLGAAQSVPPEVAAQVAPILADAFAATFWVALVLLILAVIPALFLPRKPPAATAPTEAAEPADVTGPAAVTGPAETTGSTETTGPAETTGPGDPADPETKLAGARD